MTLYFKADWSFLEKISMGVAATCAAMDVLRAQEHQIIELERYSTSKKIWQTKIKRLRVPDLLCLNCGNRYECRGKSKLEVSMSHSDTDPTRAWDFGLRNNDVAVFIACRKDPHTGLWEATSVLNAFRIGDLRDVGGKAILSRPKSREEAAERDLEWPSYVPSFSGTVHSATADSVILQKRNGRLLRRDLERGGHKMFAYLKPGQEFEAGSTIVASVVPRAGDIKCSARRGQYQFDQDLQSRDTTDQYIAAKALRHNAERAKASAKTLSTLLKSTNVDPRLRLETAATLVALGDEEGWSFLERCTVGAADHTLTMEAVLILGEIIDDQRAQALLSGLARNAAIYPEVRAAAVWSMQGNPELLEAVVPLLGDSDDGVAMHAVVAASQMVEAGNCRTLVRQLGKGDRLSSGIVRVFLESDKEDWVEPVVDEAIKCTDPSRRSWLFYLVGCLGKPRVDRFLGRYGTNGKRLATEVALFWHQFGSDWTWDSTIADKIKYIRMQVQ